MPCPTIAVTGALYHRRELRGPDKEKREGKGDSKPFPWYREIKSRRKVPRETTCYIRRILRQQRKLRKEMGSRMIGQRKSSHACQLMWKSRQRSSKPLSGVERSALPPIC